MSLLLGIAAAGARPGHVLLAVAAVSAYLFSVAAVDWLRTRRPEHLRPASVYGLLLAISGIPLVVQWPGLALLVAGVIAAGLAALAVALAGHPKSVVVSLLEVAQAIALVPASAIISGTLGEPATARAAIAASVYLVGSVLLVRSMIRERGNTWFLAASIGFHAFGLLAMAAVLGWPYAVLAAALLARAIALPLAQARSDGRSRRLRPVHIGIVEIGASIALGGLAFTVGF